MSEEAEQTPDDKKVSQRAPRAHRRSPMLETVPFVAISILLSVFIFILVAMFSNNGGLLGRMAQPQFARGLITYLFAVVTIGTAVVLLIAGLTHEVTEDTKTRFDRGKDILSLLLGVFGTIVGFYFGSATTDTQATQSAELTLSPPLIGRAALKSGEAETVTAFVRGGTPPYRYGIAFGTDGKLEYTSAVDPVGWIAASREAPPVNKVEVIPIRIGVQDAAGQSAEAEREVSVSPAGVPLQ